MVCALGRVCGGGKHLLGNPVIHGRFNLSLVAFDHAQVIALLRSHNLGGLGTQEPGIKRDHLVV